MKPWIPRFIYLTFLLGCGLYFWRTLQTQNQLLFFLNRATNETSTVVLQQNWKIVEEYEQFLLVWRSELMFREFRHMHQVDSLIKLAHSGKITMDEIRSDFDTLTHAEFANAMMQLLPARNVRHLSAPGCRMLAQNDSIRQQIAGNVLFNFFASRVNGPQIRLLDSFEPVFSCTTLCSSKGQQFIMDVLLSNHHSLPNPTQISVNGEQLKVEKGQAYFRQTYSAAGDYPLNVKAQTPIFGWRSDTEITTEKTFFIHVNR